MTAFFEVANLDDNNKPVMVNLDHVHAIIEDSKEGKATLFLPSGAVNIAIIDLVSMIHESKASYFKKESAPTDMTDEQVVDMLESEIEDLVEEGEENA